MHTFQLANRCRHMCPQQAYVLARQDPACSDLAKRMEAMMFLATPHKGSNLAHILNNILRASATLTPRSYISNLNAQNELIGLLNESFRHYASDVALYSFYESRATDMYVRSETIVSKESAVMGYRHERHAMLDADHRTICKFETPSDPNYTAICEALRSMTEGILRRLSSEKVQEIWREMQQIESFLAMPARPDDDLKDLEEARVGGSCEWFAERDTFQRWADPDSEDMSMVYWISANPATGKSVLSGYIINTLTNLSLDCSYYFFRHGDKDRSTVSGCLRSLLYQEAARSAEVRQQLLSMIEKGIRYNKDDTKVIWRKLVWPVLSHPNISRSAIRYWVLDALDECAAFQPLFAMMASLEPEPRIRILITSRRVHEITQYFTDLRQQSPRAVSVCMEEISLENTKIDIALYLDRNRYKLHVGDERQKDTFMDLILDKSEGCFLWVRLVLDELALAWSVGEVQRILDEVPQDMDPLYMRAIKIMSSRFRPNRDLTRAILTWVVCSIRPLTVSELREALKLDLDLEVPELETAITSLCAQLVHVDKAGRVMIVHLTAKTFLTDNHISDSEFYVDIRLGHLRLATNCLRFLCSDEMKVPRARRLKRKQQNQAPVRSAFAKYACLEFAEHLRHTPSANSEVSAVLYGFLETNILAWIEIVASAGNLSILTSVANSMNSYLQRHIRTSSPLGEFVHLTQNWAIDLHRIVAGLGPSLLAYPSAIYWLIPPFCPKSSAIATAIMASNFNRMSVRGLKDEGWNDRLACIDSHDKLVSAVACADTVFAVGYNNSLGTVVLHHNNTCLSWKTLQHGSPVRHLLFNGPGTHLVSAGRRDIKIWDLETGFVLWESGVLTHDVMTIAISENGKLLVAADKSNTFTSWDFKSGRRNQKLDWSENLPFHDERGFRRPPIGAAFSPDLSLVAIVYRGRPICLYDLEDDEHHGLVSRQQDPSRESLGADTSVMSLVFNSKKSNHTLAACYEDEDLCLFDYEELTLLKTVQAHAHTLACSPDGLTLLTGNSAGMVQLLEFDTLQLLYRVNAADYGIRSLSISADNMRFIDGRGTQANVWEPAVLSLGRRDESSTEPADWEPIIKSIDSDEIEITCLEPDDSGRFAFVGRSDGSLSFHDITSGQRRRVLYRHSFEISVTSIIWGSQKRFIATSDTACRFIVCSLVPDEQNGESDWKVAVRLMDRKADSRILQLLLNATNGLLLVSTEVSNSVWNVTTRQLISRHNWKPAPTFSWLNHPGTPSHRTLVSSATVSVFEWESSREIASTLLHQSAPETASVAYTESSEQPDSDRHSGPIARNVLGVKRASTFAKEKFLVVQLSHPYEERSIAEAKIFRLAPLPDAADEVANRPTRPPLVTQQSSGSSRHAGFDNPQLPSEAVRRGSYPATSFLVPAAMFGQVGQQMKHVIGSYTYNNNQDSRLVFVDASRWVCSVSVDLSNPMATGTSTSSSASGSYRQQQQQYRRASDIDGTSKEYYYYVRHFPIPSDWQSQQRRFHMAVTRNGDVLFARTNEVAIISRGLEFEERVQVETGPQGFVPSVIDWVSSGPGSGNVAEPSLPHPM